MLIQKQVVCIGSRGAPILSDIFLGDVDVRLEQSLAGRVVRIVRYVDD